MNTKILVPLKRHDRLEEIIPYIEKVAQPGASVLLLVRSPVSGLKWLQAYCGIAQWGLERNLALQRMIESYSLKTRAQLTERRVFQTCGALHGLAMKIGVEVYAGSLRKALQRFANDREAPLVIMQPGIGQRLVSFLQKVSSKGWVAARSFSSSVLLFHART
jgi:hypothetical protein